LKALLLSPDHPIQLVFAGKAHPADDIGKEMIRQIVHFSSDPAVRHRIAFIEDYDIGVARILYQGADVWLNNPRRPLEACGTSGEKAALNGALNCSILDGWWAEMFNGENGWAISSAESYADLDRRDHAEADSLFEILERQVVPLFYDRAEGRLPKHWVRRVKSSLSSLGPQVLAARMVRDYIERMYEPVAGHADRLAADGYTRARDLAAWKERMLAAWDDVRVESVEADTTMADLGSTRHVDVVVALGSLSPDDVAVEVVHGPTGPNDELSLTSVSPMTPAGEGRYTGSFTAAQAGRYGFTVRVIPRNEGLLQPAELGLMAWA
jgi:glycogen phosphorylase